MVSNGSVDPTKAKIAQQSLLKLIYSVWFHVLLTKYLIKLIDNVAVFSWVLACSGRSCWS